MRAGSPCWPRSRRRPARSSSSPPTWPRRRTCRPLRYAQVEAIWYFIAEHDELERNCLFLTGNFNAEPDSDEIRKLCGHKPRR